MGTTDITRYMQSMSLAGLENIATGVVILLALEKLTRQTVTWRLFNIGQRSQDIADIKG